MTQRTLGRYRVHERIGRGAMGLVYRGEDPKLDRIVALKVILPPSDDPASPETREAVDRLYAEARAAARITHPAIVTVYDVGEDETEAGPVVYIAMEFLEGENLDQWRRNQKPGVVESLRLIRRIAEGLATAHHRGVIHRDVKPSNIVMTPTGAKLTDFGLAQLHNEVDSSLAGKVVGSPAFMSPEQVEGEKIGPPSDIFSLSLVLYLLLTGRHPFLGENVMATMYNIVNIPPPLPTSLSSELPPSADTVLMKGLAKRAELRYPTAEEFIAGLDLLLTEMGGEANERTDADDRAAASPSFPTVIYSVDDDELSRRLGPYFKRKRIPCHKSPPLPERELAKHLTVQLRKGELALVHFSHKTYFQPTLTTFTVADLLKVIRQFDPTAPTKRLIPLFITDATSKKQREVVRLLGAYGVSYALFLSPSDPLPEQERLIGDALVDFVELLENDFDQIADAPSGFDETQMAPTKQYQELLALGNDLMERGKIEEAIEAFTQALALKPDFDLLIHRGDAYYQTRKYVAALTDYRKAQSLKNSTPEPDAKIGACCLILAKELKKEEPAKAAEWFDKGVARLETSRERAKELEATYADDPERLGGSPYGAILKALRAVDIGVNDFDDDRKRLSAVIETAVLKTGAMGDDDLDTLLDRGAGMAALGRYDEAEELFRTAFRHHPVETIPACNNFAVALRKGGQFERAFELFLMMAEAKGADHDRILKNMRTAAMHYAHALIVGGKGEEAEKIYTRALKLKMDDPEWALCDLAMAHFHAGSPSTAKIYLNKAIARNPAITSARRFADYKGLAPLLPSTKSA